MHAPGHDPRYGVIKGRKLSYGESPKPQPDVPPDEEFTKHQEKTPQESPVAADELPIEPYIPEEEG